MGAISAHQVQQLSHCAVLDGASHPEILQLAALGAFGSSPANCTRDLKRMFLREQQMWPPLPLVVKVQCRDTKAMAPNILHHEECHMLLPHEVLSALFHKRPEDAEALLGLPSVAAFWHNVAPEEPRLRAKGGHPLTTWQPGWESSTIPLWMHGDGVEFQDRDSLLVFSFGSLMTTTSSQDASFFIVGFPKSVTSKSRNPDQDTWQKLFEIMAWSFKACLEGRHPQTDYQGRPFSAGSEAARVAGQLLTPAGHRFVLWSLLGDLEYFCNVLKMPHWNTDEFCWLCNCSKSDQTRHYTDVRDHPGWQLKSPQEMAGPVSPHPIFTVPGVSEWCLQLDVLHVLDHHGLAGHLVGGVLHSWVFKGENRTMASREAALAAIWADIQRIYVEDDVSVKLTNLRMTMLVADIKSPFADWVQLRQVKGAETRHLVPVVAKLAAAAAHGDRPGQHMAGALHHLNKFYQLLDSCSMLPSVEEGEQLELAMQHCLVEYRWLHTWATEQGKKMFQLVPKFHFSKHLGQQSKHLNSRFCWTYRAESWVGKISKQAHSCSNGVKTTRLTKPLVEKYRMLLHLRLQRQFYD